MASNDDGLGFSFWAKMAGAVALFGIAGLIIMLIVWRALYAWGFLGCFIAFAGVMLLIAWFYDRRQVKEYEES